MAAVVGQGWHERSAAAGEVLDAIAAVHSDEPVVEAARKALVKLRSATSQRPASQGAAGARWRVGDGLAGGRRPRPLPETHRHHRMVHRPWPGVP